MRFSPALASIASLVALTGPALADYQAVYSIAGNAQYYGATTTQATRGEKTYSGSMMIVETLPFNVPVNIVNQNGGPISGSVRITIVSGNAHPQGSGATHNVSGTDWTLSSISINPRGLFAVGGPGATGNYDFDAPALPVNVEGTTEFGVLIEKLSQGGGAGSVEDSVELTVTVSANFQLAVYSTGPASPNNRHLASIGSIYLYEDGILPPGGREGVEPEGDIQFTGTITNDSDLEQTFTLVGVDENGNPVKLYEVTIPPGETVTLPPGLTANLPEGTEIYVLTSGITSGLGQSSFGEGSHTLDVTFPPGQTRGPVRIIGEGPSDTIRILGGDSSQEFLPPQDGPFAVDRELATDPATGTSGPTPKPAGVSEGGGIAIEGGEIVHEQRNSDGSTTIVVLGGGSTVTGKTEAITIGAVGEGVAAILQTSSGTTINTGGGNVTPTTAGTHTPNATGGGGGAATGAQVSSTISTGQLDAAARVLTEIMATLQAGANAVGGADTTPGSLDAGEAIATGEGSPGAGIVEASGNMADFQEFFGMDGIATIADNNPIPETPSFGTKSIISVPIANFTTLTLDLDLPIIQWVRGILLAFISISWFFLLLKILRT